MLKDLLPNTPISSNTIIPAENITIQEEDKLRVYEFDVSFKRYNYNVDLKRYSFLIFRLHLNIKENNITSQTTLEVQRFVKEEINPNASLPHNLESL
jgi:hypothetical protein